MAFSPVPVSANTSLTIGGGDVGSSGLLEPLSDAFGALADEFVWVGGGVHPSSTQIATALDVLAAVPMAGGVGWSVRGQPWSTHGRRIRTAVVKPREGWDIRCMRGVREVDSLSGRVLARRRHLGAVSFPSTTVGSAPNTVARSLRSAGFRLLLLGAD